MEENCARVRISKDKQKEIFRAFVTKFNKDVEAADFLGISKYNLSDYKNYNTKYIPLVILQTIVDYLGIDMPHFYEVKTLKEIRKFMVNRATLALRNKYGSNLKDVLRKGSRKALEKKYGLNAYKIITKKGHGTLELNYGKDWRKKISEKGIEALKNKYGEAWFDVTLKKGRESLKKKYGVEWQKKLSRLGRKSHNQKYITDFNKIPAFHRGIFAKRKPTLSEQFIIDSLNGQGIPFESNVLEEDLEFDIIVPNRSNPRYIIEVSDAKPTTYNQRKKILQLYQQKKRFPKAQIIALLRTCSLGKNSNFYLHKITKDFLDNEKQ